MTSFLLNHLWQSSLFAGGAGLLTTMLHRNSANARFWLWFAASVKFLVPFAGLSVLAGYFLAPIAQPMAGSAVILMPLAQPFSAAASAVPVAKLAIVPAGLHFDLDSVLLSIWIAGFAVIGLRWLRRWLRVRVLLSDAVAVPIAAPITVKASASRLEPGLVGIRKPVIVIPAGIEQQLCADEMRAIIAHEVCHWRRRDNLLAAIHMMVEALFWYFPLVWWLGARLNAERERACDEEVLAHGNDPKTYAEGILKVCRIYLQSPLACVSGVSGAGLKKRMYLIMENRKSVAVSAVMKVVLSTAAVAALALPVVLALSALPGTAVHAQPAASPMLNAERRAEQALPRKAVPFNPAHFDRFVGYYQLAPAVVFTISRNDTHFFGRLTGQINVEEFPESETKFFSTQVPAQISFNSDPQGRVTELVLHQGGLEQHAPRISESTAKGIEAALKERIRANKPSPGTKAALRHQIESMETGHRDYGALTPTLAYVVREAEPSILASLSSMGALKSITFRSVTVGGLDNYRVEFERSSSDWFISPLTNDGKIGAMAWRRLP